MGVGLVMRLYLFTLCVDDIKSLFFLSSPQDYLVLLSVPEEVYLQADEYCAKHSISVWKNQTSLSVVIQHSISSSGHSNPSPRETGSQHGKLAAVKNGSHPNLSTNSTTGYFSQQRDGETTHDTVISSVQMHSLHSAETSSST